MTRDLSKQRQAQRRIEETLREVGLEKGDVVLVHSDATPAMTLGEFEWWEEALSLLGECFLEVLGAEGTLVVPTFNYEFCKGKPYSHEETPSQVGMFTNFVRRDKRAIRSFHPIFSFAAMGAQAKEICENVPTTSFGNDSVFHRLHQINAKLLFFNVSFEYCTFIHYVEQGIGVDYRYLKQFRGKVSCNGAQKEFSVEYNVRDLERDVHTYLTPLGNDLLERGKMKWGFLIGSYPVSQVSCDDVWRVAIERVKENPYYLLKHPPVNTSTIGGKTP